MKRKPGDLVGAAKVVCEPCLRSSGFKSIYKQVENATPNKRIVCGSCDRPMFVMQPAAKPDPSVIVLPSDITDPLRNVAINAAAIDFFGEGSAAVPNDEVADVSEYKQGVN